VRRTPRDAWVSRLELSALNADLEKWSIAHHRTATRQCRNPALCLYRQPRPALSLVNVMGFTAELEAATKVIARSLTIRPSRAHGSLASGRAARLRKTCPRRSASSAAPRRRWTG
jgi:hypothetical protein